MVGRFSIPDDSSDEDGVAETWSGRPSTQSILAAVLAQRVARTLRTQHVDRGKLPKSAFRGKGKTGAVELARARRFLFVAAFAPEYFCIRARRTGRKPDDRWVAPRATQQEWAERNRQVVAQRRQGLVVAASAWAPGPYDEPLWRTHRLGKSGGATRTISIPHPGLRAAQIGILRMLAEQFKSESGGKDRSSFGMLRGSGSIVNNALCHQDARVVASFDLADCFDRIGFEAIFRLFLHRPWGSVITFPENVPGGNLPGLGFVPAGKYEIDSAAATFLASLVTRGRRLPQGAPTSPAIADCVLRELDSAIRRDLQDAGLGQCRYSRYFDDLTFSMTKGALPAARLSQRRFEGLIANLVGSAALRLGYSINQSKSRMMDGRNGVLITGVMVKGRELGIPGSRRKRIRAICHRASTGGLSSIEATPASSLDWNEIRAIRNRFLPQTQREDATRWRRVLSQAKSETWPKSGSEDKFASFLQAFKEQETREAGREPLPAWDGKGRGAGPCDQVSIDYAELPEGVRDRALPDPAMDGEMPSDIAGFLGRVPADWLRVRVIVETGGEEVEIRQRFGRAAWNDLEVVLESNAPPDQILTSIGRDYAVLRVRSNDATRVTMGIHDSVGIVPSILAAASEARLHLIGADRLLRGHLAAVAQIPEEVRSPGARKLIAELDAALRQGWDCELAKPKIFRDAGEVILSINEKTAAQKHKEAAAKRSADMHERAIAYWRKSIGEDAEVYIGRIETIVGPERGADLEEWFEALKEILYLPGLRGVLPSRSWPSSDGGPSDRETPLGLAAFALEVLNGERRGVYGSDDLIRMFPNLGEDSDETDWHAVRQGLRHLSAIQSTNPSGSSLPPVQVNERLPWALEQFLLSHESLVKSGIVVPPMPMQSRDQLRELVSLKAGTTRALAGMARLIWESTITKQRKVANGSATGAQKFELSQSLTNDFLGALPKFLAKTWQEWIRELRNMDAHENHQVAAYLNEHSMPSLMKLRKASMHMIGRSDSPKLPDGNEASSELLDDLFSATEAQELACQLLGCAAMSFRSIEDARSTSS